MGASLAKVKTSIPARQTAHTVLVHSTQHRKPSNQPTRHNRPWLAAAPGSHAATRRNVLAALLL